MSYEDDSIRGMDKTKAIAAALGEGWTASRPEPQEGDPVWMYPPLLHGPAGLQLRVRFGGYRREGRIEISGDLDHELRPHLRYNEREPSITVADGRSPEQIAREITRRLLSACQEQHERTMAAKAAADEYERNREAYLAEVLTFLQPHGSRLNNDRERHALHLNHGGVYAVLNVTPDHVRVESLTIDSREGGLRLARLLGELAGS